MLWEAYLGTPAVRLLSNVARLRPLIELAYRPSMQRVRDSVLAAGSYDSRRLAHFARVISLRDSLTRLRQRLAATDLIGEAGRLASEYLPAGTLGQRCPPVLAFGIYEPAGYGGNDGITLDLLLAADREHLLVRTVAHEIHHYHVGHLTHLVLPPRSDPAFLLLRSIRNLANEGIADRIDLQFPFAPPEIPAEIAGDYNADYSAGAAVARQLDSMLVMAAADSGRLRAIGTDFSRMQRWGGHGPGTYMAELIEKQLGRDALIRVVDNPFAFLRAYSDAELRSSGSPVFTQPARDALTRLERAYTAR